ncbi:hypothetical protein [Plantibacter sp. YIM 135347]|uniref:hypothetical protein n=1 Tax=Plantibacter sp. YIM 135347 TaxID=3423919 RepID=UPI003D324E7F
MADVFAELERIETDDTASQPSSGVSRGWKIAIVAAVLAASAAAVLAIVATVGPALTEAENAVEERAMQRCITELTEGNRLSSPSSAEETEARCTMLAEDGSLVARFGD